MRLDVLTGTEEFLDDMNNLLSDIVSNRTDPDDNFVDIILEGLEDLVANTAIDLRLPWENKLPQTITPLNAEVIEQLPNDLKKIQKVIIAAVQNPDEI